MPTYEFKCNEIKCNHEWELEQSIKAPDPEECPQCKVKGNITRLISGCSGRVELSGHELRAKTKEDAIKFQKEVYSNERTYANVIGEDRYQKIQQGLDAGKRNRPR
jgi:putative FmdB family regulatory protein